MPEQQGEDKTSQTSRRITEFATEFLSDDAVALVIRQQLLPDDIDNPVIFPPTYLKAKGKTQDDDKDEEPTKDNEESVYNIDSLGDGKNICEIDSPQSDANRSEPLFKSDSLKHLVPQIVISVNGTPCNLLDAGHRAGDAVVRLSSLAAEFYDAFTRAEIGDHSILATLAPTSILYGVWDSRSTQTKLQRIIKASVRAQNVKPLTKSATFIPALDYVAIGAVKEELNVGKGDNNPLSSEGMLHALATQTRGGVRLTDPKLLIRTIKINLAALRQLRAIVDPPKPDDKATDESKKEIEKATEEAKTLSKIRTEALRNYILGLALVAATSDPDLNLRQGCNLRVTGDDHWNLVRHRKDDERVIVDRTAVLNFAKRSGEAFFNAMGISFAGKDHLDARFEKDVAEQFLGLTDSKGKLSGTERDKVRKRGPITKGTLAAYLADRRKREKAGDPVQALRKLVDALAVSAKNRFNKAPREKLASRLAEIEGDAESTDDLRELASKINPLLTDDTGAAERRTQMLALFPASTTETPVDTPQDIPTETNEEPSK